MISTYEVFHMVREIEVKKKKIKIHTYMYISYIYVSHIFEIHNKCLISMGGKTSAS